jgi:cytidine deaminase
VAVACIDAATVDDAYPCGRCRQIMSEFGVETVHVTTADGEVRHHTLDDLLPHRFSL